VRAYPEVSDVSVLIASAMTSCRTGPGGSHRATGVAVAWVVAVVPRTPRVTVRDQCGASDLQGLVGRPRTEIPIPVDPNRQRVACTTCPVTLDYNPQRLNFFFDAQTGILKEIRCG